MRSAFFAASVAFRPGVLIVLIGEVAMVNDERRLRVRRGVLGCTLMVNGDGCGPANDSYSRGCEASFNPAVKNAE